MRSYQSTISIKDITAENPSSESKDKKYFAYWERYNTTKAGLELEDTYTPHFMRDYELTQYLNEKSKSILQLGASTGGFIETYQQKGWSVLGYDYSPISIKHMLEKNIPARLINLNTLHSLPNSLIYKDLLQSDMQKYCNIFMFRVLNYLDMEAQTYLLHLIISNSLPGTVFFIGDQFDESKGYEKAFPETKRNFKTSFFAPRTDMEFLRNTTVHLSIESHNRNDELIVIRKRG